MYQVIYADPPWKFLGSFGQADASIGYQGSYDDMENEDILKLPVQKICENDCALFLWVVNSKVDFGIEVIKAWGFKYKQVAFCWVKTSKAGNPSCRLGYWTLGGMELCLLGIKGKMGNAREDYTVRQVLLAPRIGHSRKPPEIRKRIEQLFDGPRLELFAREQTIGWDVWGNDVENSITLPTVTECT